MRALRSVSAIVAIAAGVSGLFVSILSPVLSGDTTLGIEESLGLDILYTLRGPVVPEANVIVVALSSEAGERLGLGAALEDERELSGWPRPLHAELLAILKAVGARAVVFDLHFRREQDPAGDRALAQAIGSFGDVLLLELLDRDEAFSGSGRGGGGFRMVTDRAQPPIAILDEAARGSVPFPLPDVNSEVNRYWTFVDRAADAPTLPVAAFALYAESSHESLLRHLATRLPPGRALDIDSGDLDRLMPDVRRLLAANPEILSDFRPAGDPAADTLRELYTAPDLRYINYYGPPMSITTVRADQVLLEGPDPSLPWQDAVVFVGLSERAQSDQQDEFHSFYSQRSGLRLSGVEIAATALANLIEGRSLGVLPIPAQLIVITIIGILLGLTFRLQSTAWVLAAMTLILGGYVLIARGAFIAGPIWLPVAVPLLVQAPVALISGLLLRHSQAEARRTAVTVGASRYLPSELVARMSENPDAAARGSDLVHGVCMVTDVEQFTSRSESLPPRELEEALNAYYDRLFEIVAAHGGIVTDIVGDSMVAVWRSTEGPGSAQTAPLAAALRISSLSAGNDANFWRTRTGLHQGEFVLGTVGAREHLEYRAVGDTVNTASRIQSLNKQLGTLALATADVLADRGIAWRPLGRFRLSGKQQVLEIGEPLAFATGLSEQQRLLIDLFGQALDFFQQDRLNPSLRLFEQAFEQFNSDGPSGFYVAHIRELLAGTSAPAPKGVIHLPD